MSLNPKAAPLEKHRSRGRFHAPRLRDAIRLYEALTRQDDKAGARDTSSTQSAKIAGDAAQHRTSNPESRLRWGHSRLVRKLSRRLGTKDTQQDGTTAKGGLRQQSPGQQQTCRLPEPRDEASSRERISHGGATLVAQASCALEQPRPVRANEIQQLLSLCRGSHVASPTGWRGRRGRSQWDYC
ncbi:Arb2 domain-containing protein [Ophiocordyceps camponoti-floridani]|uniref:Arb2 domain-containing protein n=1 Tax=Ophiocordyceps camponoti-floridani TaxID=2030778 RepID=A0A8H4QAI5_9HYPO|nr:Arb2 domain-containing protein [Ophiocordyceps camponoti-floridani]